MKNWSLISGYGSPLQRNFQIVDVNWHFEGKLLNIVVGRWEFYTNIIASVKNIINLLKPGYPAKKIAKLGHFQMSLEVSGLTIISAANDFRVSIFPL